MTNKIISIGIFTFTIHLISTLAYAVRTVGIRTGRIAVAYALFNLFLLVVRLSHALQAPLLAKIIEQKFLVPPIQDMLPAFRYFLLAASVGTLVGAALIPTFQRVFSRAVQTFALHRSVPKLLMHGCSKIGIHHVREHIRIPSNTHLAHFATFNAMPKSILLMNVVAVALLTVGAFAPLYAGYLHPALRVTSSNLSALVSGLAIILLFVFIDPYFSMLTDDVIQAKQPEALLRSGVVFLVASRFLGTLIAQFLLLPAASLIARVAEWL